MTTMWGVHNDQPQLDLVGSGFISIGWPAMGDLSAIGNDQEAMKKRVAAAYPDLKPGAIPGTAGTLRAFAFRMKPGDLVVYPHRPDGTLNFGRIDSDYFYDGNAPLHRNRRKVIWSRVGIPRTTFSQSARYEVGAAITIFQVRKHLAEFLAFLDEAPDRATPVTPSPGTGDPVEQGSDEPSAERIQTYTRDFIVDTIMRELEGAEFEHFVAHLLGVMGYRTRVTQVSGDGGVDVIAHKDPLGLEPPIIKVQCKRTTGTISGPDVQRLTGTLAPGGSELGLFITLGAYSKDAQHIGRTRQDLRLINGNELIELIFAHYDRFSPEYKRLFPMKSVYVVDQIVDGV